MRLTSSHYFDTLKNGVRASVLVRYIQNYAYKNSSVLYAVVFSLYEGGTEVEPT
jgi:hypothetical protein